MPLKWKPMEELWLRSQERFALGFKGKGPADIGWIWFRVMDREYKNVTPHTKSFSNITVRGGVTTFNLLEDGDDELLDVTENFAKSIIIHAGLGIKPVTNDLRVYVQFPTGTDLHQILAVPPTDVGADFAYVTAMDSPFDNPTEALEFFIPYNYTLSLAFADVERVAESSIFPSINIVQMAYLFELLIPGKDKATDLLISQMARGAKKCRYKVIGAVEDPAQYTVSLQNHLQGVEPITINEAQALVKGGA